MFMRVNARCARQVRPTPRAGDGMKSAAVRGEVPTGAAGRHHTFLFQIASSPMTGRVRSMFEGPPQVRDAAVSFDVGRVKGLEIQPAAEV